MMNGINVRFTGLCTHLIANNTWVRGARPLSIRNEDGPVTIRTFIANSDPEFVNDLIDPGKCIPKHVAKIVFGSEPDDATKSYFNMKNHGPWEGELRRVTIKFRNVALTDAKIKQSFTRLPSVWSLTSDSHWHEPLPHPDVLLGRFPLQANVYVDFATGFTIARVRQDGDSPIEDNVNVALTPGKDALLMEIRKMSNGDSIKIPLNADITISNEPENKSDPCAANDYLLHYFVTTMDLRNNPPEWLFDRDGRGIVSPEVYCSSSGYP